MASIILRFELLKCRYKFGQILVLCLDRITDSIKRYIKFYVLIDFSHKEQYKNSHFAKELENMKIHVFPNTTDWVSTNRSIFVYTSFTCIIYSKPLILTSRYYTIK